MTIALFALAEASPAQTTAKESSKKAPPKRTVQAIADQRPAPEPR